MDRSIQEVAKLAGTTSRTLRHYDDVALVRLQRILLLRELGLGLAQIADVLARGESEERALEGHLAWLREEQTRLARQIASVQSTIEALRGGDRLMAERMFDGFDHTRHKDEVEERWGAEAYAEGDRWWRSQRADERADWKRRSADLGRDWVEAAASGVAPDSLRAQELARRHVAWLAEIPGTPAATPGGDVRGYVRGLGDLYVADERFAQHYGGATGAAFVRDALRVYADAAPE